MELVSTTELFLPLQVELVALLRSLGPKDWSLPTIAGSWRVKDVAAHLLDGDLRRISLHRDGHSFGPPGSAPPDYQSLLAYLNGLNASWVDATERLSPGVMTDLLEWSGPQLADFFASLPPHGAALFPVAWAGEESSENWMDISREYTEKWHHQAQIRDAVGAPLLMSRRWLYPVLALSMYALPHSFRRTDAPEGSALNISIEGEAGGLWSLVREAGRWSVRAGAAPGASAGVRMDADTAWRLFFNGLGREEAGRRVEATGDGRLCSTFISTRAVMV
ncbi:MAG TPA: maleylpyruvate isomerase N-terminal domain-containing protein [Blastocatellia bacterium]|nr:maleylpyruvate isomerase N-terminal domain-containing protein [Blastocatellia bacterium]